MQLGPCLLHTQQKLLYRYRVYTYDSYGHPITAFSQETLSFPPVAPSENQRQQ